MTWYLLRTATRREAAACESLTELKVEFYVPQETVWRKLNGEQGPYDRPLFPGYLFAFCPDDDAYLAAVSADGVHAPVRMTNAAGERIPLRVRPSLVAQIMAAQDAGEFDRTKPDPENPPKEWEVGEGLRVVSGHFEFRAGTFLEMRAHDRIAALIGGCTVELNLDQVEAAA